MANEKKEFNPSVGFWPTKKGTGYTVFLTPEVISTLQKATEGGSLFLSAVDEEFRNENPKAPTYRIVIFPPSDGKQSTAANDSL